MSPHRTRTPRVLSVVVVLASLLVVSCGDMAFREDDRLAIVAPDDRAKVTLPFVVEWTADDRPKVERFAIFVDRLPMPPGKSLRHFAREDDACLRRAGCPDEGYLAERNVFTTDGRAFTVTGLLDTRPTSRKEARDRHEIHIVPLDAGAARIGEAVHTVVVYVDRGRGT